MTAAAAVSPPLCCSPPAAVSPPPQFAGDPEPTSPRHFIWPPPSQNVCDGTCNSHHYDVMPVSKQPLKTLNCSPSYFLRSYVNSQRGSAAKRKSAVELLQESKAYYVKSEHVLDKKQELKNSGHLHVASPAVDLFLRAPANNCGTKTTNPLSSSPPAVHPSGHQRALSLDKAGFNTLPPRLPERTGSQSPPPLPPKSPRVAARPRARTVTSAPVTSAQVRRSHSQHANDVQMKLRKLLSSSSSVETGGKENNDQTDGKKQQQQQRRNGPRYRRLLDDEEDEDACLELELSLGELGDDCCFDDNSPPFDSKTVAGEKVYLRSRHSTPTAHTSRTLLSPATHKSLPDLSPMCHTESSTTTPGSDDEEEETSGASSGRRRYYPGSRATSDYVSRSPSSCKCCGGRRSVPSEAGSAPARALPCEADDDISADSGDSLTGACRTTTDSRRSSPRAESQPGGPRSPSPTGTRRRPILRSKSDISHRYSRAAFLAPIVRTVADEMEDPQLSPPANLPRRSSADLERFFEQLGLEEDAYKVITSGKRGSRDSTASPVFFESVSSVDSWPGTWGANGTLRGGSGESGPAPTGPGGSKLGEQPSIVERNARIIKWLCNCRKAQLGALS